MEKQSASWVRTKCIGKGAFGTVSLAIDKYDNVFAVKSVDITAGLPAQIQSLENEIRILRSLSSPYVVEFLGDDVSFDPPTTSYRNLHMEYLPAGTVADMAIAGDVDDRLLRSYIWCLVSALRYVHSKGIVHGDVKGKNVIVAGAGVAKLADFGSAAEFNGEIGKSPIMPRGSPLWMAPEVIRRESQGPKSDVWSLGCTVIEMITGKPAWKDDGIDTLKRIGFSDELPEFRTGLTEIGRDFLAKCLRRDLNERWSCDQLLQHPFISAAAPNTVLDSSPRCVLDWINSEFEEEDEDCEEISSSNGDFENSGNLSARVRIGKLATSIGVNWEMEGWTVVRTLDSAADTEAAEAGKCTDGQDVARAVVTEEEGRAIMSIENSGGVVLQFLLVEWRRPEEFAAEKGWMGLCNLLMSFLILLKKLDYTLLILLVSLKNLK